MTHADIIQHRLYNQQISHPGLKTPAEVVSWLGAMQGQDYFGGKWAFGLRLPGYTDANIDEAIANRSIVRTWALRGTLHFLAADDIRWILKFLDRRLASLYSGTYLKMGLDRPVLKKSKTIISKALEGGKQLTRKELMEAHELKGIPTNEMRGSFLLGRAALDGHICFGERKGNQFTFALLDEWLPPSREKDNDEALLALILRYFNSHGPATEQDFKWWSGLTLTEVRAGLDMAGKRLSRHEVNGQVYLMGAEQEAPRKKDAVYLLSGFDEYIVAYRDRDLVLKPENNKTVLGFNGMFAPTVLINGKVVAIWKRSIKKDKVVISLEPFVPITAAKQAAIAVAARKYGKFLGMDVVI